MDTETRKIVTEQSRLQELVSHDGWKIARKRITDEIMDLQNAFNIKAETPEKMLIDLESRKLASLILFDWLRQLEGDAVSAEDNKKIGGKDEKLIVRLD